MPTSPGARLRAFYDQALLTPDLLCLSCARVAWNRAACRCSAQRREDCFLFAGDMVNQLGRMVAREKNRRPAPVAEP